MSVLKRNLKQDATHWTVTPADFGGATYGSPIVLGCRWEDKAVLFRDAQGEEVTSDAVVYLAADVAVGDFLFLGVSVATDPTTLSGSRRVRQFHRTPDLRAMSFERKAFL
jgi:hypothetical protein